MKRRTLHIFIMILAVSFLLSGATTCLAGELSSREIRGITEGIQKIKGNSKGIQGQGYNDLKSIGPAAVPYLIEVLQDKSVSSESDTLVCNLLGDLKAKEAVPELIKALKHRVSTVRIAASQALGVIGDAEAVDPLLDILGDSEADVKKSAVDALINFNENKIPPKVTPLLNDPEEYVRAAAIKLLSEKLDPKTASAVREALKKDKSDNVRLLAVKTLGGIKDKNAVEVLMSALTEDTNRYVREESAIALGTIGDKKAIPALIKALKDPYKDIQLRASYSLKDITGQDFGRDYEKWSSWNEGKK